MEDDFVTFIFLYSRKEEKEKDPSHHFEQANLLSTSRPKHRREVAQNLIIVEVYICGDTNCTQGVNTWLKQAREQGIGLPI